MKYHKQNLLPDIFSLEAFFTLILINFQNSAFWGTLPYTTTYWMCKKNHESQRELDMSATADVWGGEVGAKIEGLWTVLL